MSSDNKISVETYEIKKNKKIKKKIKKNKKKNLTLHRATRGATRRHMATYGAIWRHTATRGATWRHTATQLQANGLRCRNYSKLKMKRKSSTKSDYTCSYCNKIFKDPVTLPCNDNICAQHLRDDLSGVDCKRVLKIEKATSTA
jgi:hypothetical protein